MISSTTSFSRIFQGGISVFLKSFRIIGLAQGFWREESLLLLMKLKKELRLE
jgi:hypothetical protein